MNLAIIAEHFYPSYSGASERFRRYLPEFTKLGINSKVFSISKSNNDFTECIDGIDVIRLSNPKTKKHPSAELTRQSINYFRKNNYWPDVVHILSHTIEAVPYLIELRMRKIPCVNSITMFPFPKTKSSIYSFKYKLHQYIRYFLFNYLIVSSQEIALACREFGINEKKIAIIPNGVNTNRFFPLFNEFEKIQLRNKLGFEKDEKIILFVGSISRRKGIDLLGEAWKIVKNKIPNIKIVIIGPYQERELNPFFINPENEESSSNRIKYLEFVSNVQDYMQNADLLVFPSRLEGMPNVVLESMACGLPCLITPFDGLPKSFGKHGVDYYLTTFDPEIISRDLLYLLNNPNILENIRSNALERVKKSFTFENSINLHSDLYSKLVNIS